MADPRDVLREKLRQKQDLKDLTPAQKFRIERDRRQAIKEREKQLKKAAQDYEKIVRQANNLKEAKQLIQKAPKEIQKRLSINTQTLEKEQQSRIDKIKNRIKKRQEDLEESRKDEREYKEENKDARADSEDARQRGYRKEIRELQKFLPKLEKGEFLDTKKIIDFADDIGDREYRQELAEERAKRARKKAIEGALESGANVSKINYEKGTATIAGQEVKLSKNQLQDIQLTSVKRAKAQQKQEAIEQLATQDLTIKELRDKGLSFDDISKIGTAQLRTQILEGAKDRKLKSDELKILGFTDKQVKALEGTKLPTNKELIQQGFSKKEIADLGKVQLRRTLIRKSKDLPLRQPRNIKEAFSQAGLGFLSKAFNEDQLKQINKNLNAPVSTTEGTLLVGKTPDRDFVDKLRLKALEGDTPSQRALLGVAATGGLIGRDIVNFFKEIPNVIDNTKELAKVIGQLGKSAITDRELLKQLGDNFSEAYKRGDPEVINDLFWLVAPLPYPDKKARVLKRYIGKGTENIKKILPKRDTIKKLNEEIKRLEDTGVNVKQRDSVAADRLRYLKDLKNLDEDLKKLDNLIDESNKVQKDFIKKPTTKKTDVRVQTADKNLDEIAKLDTKIDKQKKKLKKQRQKLGDVKKAKGLKELFEVPKPIKERQLDKLTKKQEKELEKYIKEKNQVKNELNKIERGLKSKNINEIKKNLLRNQAISYKEFLSKIRNQEENILTKPTSKAEKVKSLSILRNEIKKNNKRKELFNNLEKFRKKLEEKGFKELDLLPPNLRDKIKDILKDIQNVRNLSLSQLGSLNNKINNLLKTTITKAEVQGLAKKEISDIREKARKIIRNQEPINKDFITDILTRDNPKKLINQRINNIEKNIVNLRESILKEIFLFDSVKGINLKNTKSFENLLGKLIKDRKLSTDEKKRILNIEGSIKSLENRKKELLELLKNAPEKKKEVREELFLERLKKAQTKPKREIIVGNNVKFPFKIGNIEGKIEFENFGFGKRGQLGQLQKAKKPQIKLEFSNDTKKYYGKIADNTRKNFQKALRRDKQLDNRINLYDRTKGLSKKAETFDLRKLDDKQKKRFKEARKDLREQVKTLERDIEFRVLKIAARILGRAKAFKFDEVKVQARDYARAFKDINENLNKLQQEIRIDKIRKEKGDTIKKIKSLKPGKPIKFKKTPKTKVPRPNIPKKPRITKPIKPRRIPKPLPDFDLDTTPPKGQRLAFDLLYRERKNISKKFNKKSNPVVVKRKKLKAPVNEALKKAIKATDNSTTRSFQLVPVGFTKKKDIKQPKSELSKFRSRKTKKALILVEKSKHAIDTKGEKRGLSMTRALKGKKSPKKSTKKTKSKKSSKKSAKKTTKKSKK